LKRQEEAEEIQRKEEAAGDQEVHHIQRSSTSQDNLVHNSEEKY